MKLEQQVISLEQAKRLKELGIAQETEFYFREDKLWHFNEVTDWPNQEQLHNLIASGDERGNIVSAFTVAELGVMLPDNITYHRCNKGGAWDNKLHRCLIPAHGKEVVGEQGVIVPLHYDFCKHGYDTEAECKAACLIYCLESKLITPEDCNQRLLT